MKFGAVMCFDPRKNAIENGSDQFTFSTIPYITACSEKHYKKKIAVFTISRQKWPRYSISTFQIGVKTLGRLGPPRI